MILLFIQHNDSHKVTDVIGEILWHLVPPRLRIQRVTRDALVNFPVLPTSIISLMNK